VSIDQDFLPDFGSRLNRVGEAVVALAAAAVAIVRRYGGDESNLWPVIVTRTRGRLLAPVLRVGRRATARPRPYPRSGPAVPERPPSRRSSPSPRHPADNERHLAHNGRVEWSDMDESALACE
jgi:hypothetical protein